MKKTFSSLALTTLIFFTALPAQAGIPVTCTNCSDKFLQKLEYVKTAAQLVELAEQTVQLVKITEMELQNLAKLGEGLAENPLNYLEKLAHLTAELNTYRNEQKAMAEIFNELWPEQSHFADLAAAATEEEIEEANRQYREHYDTWSKKIDEASMATFQLTGRQLQEMADAGELKNYLENLLTKPEGQMQALEAGNQLAALQIEEIRAFRELTATQAQHQVINEMKQEKLDQAATEQWRKATEFDEELQTKNEEPITDFVPRY